MIFLRKEDDDNDDIDEEDGAKVKGKEVMETIKGLNPLEYNYIVIF